jgi:hypothetical protein
MDRDAFAKQFIEGLASRGATKDDIAKILPKALADFDSKQQLQQQQEPQGSTQKPFDLMGLLQSSVQSGVQNAPQNALVGGGPIPTALFGRPEQKVAAVAGPAIGAASLMASPVIAGAIGAKSINPWTIAGSMREKAAQAAPKLNVEEGVKLGKNIMDKALKAPAAFRKEAIEIAQTYSDDLKGGAGVSDILTTKSGAQDVGFLQRSGAEVRGAAAWMERETANVINGYLKQNAPDVKKADKLFQLLYGAKREIPAAIKRFGPAALLGKMISGG